MLFQSFCFSLGLADSKHCCSTDFANRFGGGLTIFHGDILVIFAVSLCSTFYTVHCHLSSPPFRTDRPVYHHPSLNSCLQPFFYQNLTRACVNNIRVISMLTAFFLSYSLFPIPYSLFSNSPLTRLAAGV